MKTPREVDASKILQKALSIANSAKKEILATMNLAEEIKHPLPAEYFLCVKRKIREGIQMIRLAFGSRSDLRLFMKRENFRHKNYQCLLAKTKRYRRMLLVDRGRLLFAVEKKGKRKFFYTADPKSVKKFFKYFSEESKFAATSFR